MKRRFFLQIISVILIIIITLLPIQVYAQDSEPGNLYSISAVLMDGESGRILYDKNGHEIRAMASTTKIMTCIIALEYGDLDDSVAVSAYAASRPKVKLGMQEGEYYNLKDLLYSLMLESHNDSAVAIAEHIGGDVKGFARLMNRKAKELGLKNTYFITPNGLDANETIEITQTDGSVVKEDKIHSTTAAELARMLMYCIKESIKKETFLEITQTASYSFANQEGTRSFSCTNHNMLLQMMSGAISGKTGFTAQAGYCYVGAVEKEGRTFIIALLGCGWPGNKNYKWKDAKTLIDYGEKYYHNMKLVPEKEMFPIEIIDGIEKTAKAVSMPAKPFTILIHENEHITRKVSYKKTIHAPMKAGTAIGMISYYLDNVLLTEYSVIIDKEIKEKDYLWYFEQVKKFYLC